MNNNIVGYDAQTGQPIYANQPNVIDKKELKRRKKEEKKKILKAREIVGTNYLITLIIVNLAPALFFENILKDNLLLQGILSWCWYIALPFLGAYILVKLDFKKLRKYITPNNYKTIRKYAIIDLTILGFFHVGINFNILIIPILISFIGSCVYVISEMDKINKEMLGVVNSGQ